MLALTLLFDDENIVETQVGCPASSSTIVNLTPSDFHLFGPLTGLLGGKNINSNEEVIDAVQEWVNMQLS